MNYNVYFDVLNVTYELIGLLASLIMIIQYFENRSD